MSHGWYHFYVRERNRAPSRTSARRVRRQPSVGLARSAGACCDTFVCVYMLRPADLESIASADDPLGAAASAMLHSRSRLQGPSSPVRGQCTAGGHLARLTMEERRLVVMESRPVLGPVRAALATSAVPGESGDMNHRSSQRMQGGGRLYDPRAAQSTATAARATASASLPSPTRDSRSAPHPPPATGG